MSHTTHLIAGKLRNNGNRRTLAFPLLPGLQGKLVLLKLVAPVTFDIDQKRFDKIFCQSIKSNFLTNLLKFYQSL